MQVSVITAVYNHANYVTQAVESALMQPETVEVLLIEDGSTDNSLAVCEKLSQDHAKVRLIRHPDGKNHGYPASLNLGIQNSKCDFIAFIDADDYFLPERFKITQERFRDPRVEGVYEAIGITFETQAAADRWRAAGRSFAELTTIRKPLPSSQLFEALLRGEYGNFSKDGLVVKRKVFEKTGLYDEHLLLHQDTAMNLKMAAVSNLVAGQIEKPVAVRRVHESNRISAPRPYRINYRNRMLIWKTLWDWGKTKLPPEQKHLVLDTLIREASWMVAPSLKNRPILRRLVPRIYMLQLAIREPWLMAQGLFWQRLFILARLTKRKG